MHTCQNCRDPSVGGEINPYHIFQFVSRLFETYESLQKIDLDLHTDQKLNGHSAGRKNNRITPHCITIENPCEKKAEVKILVLK